MQIWRSGSRVCRFLQALPLLLLLGAPLNAQCSLSLESLPQAPEFLGFQLGMTREQVKARVPQVVFGKADEFGVSKTTINPHFDPRIDKSTFGGVRSVSLDFLDDRLTSLWIGYDSLFKARSIEEFVKTISQSLALPDRWRPWRSRGKQMNCTNFQLTVTMVADGVSFRILDLSAEDHVTKRREAKAEEEVLAPESNQEAVEIVADKSSGTYYPAGCQHVRAIAHSDRVVFRSAEEAAKAGFKAARDCQ